MEKESWEKDERGKDRQTEIKRTHPGIAIKAAKKKVISIEADAIDACYLAQVVVVEQEDQEDEEQRN